MVPHNTSGDDPPRALTAEVQVRLELALRTFAAAGSAEAFDELIQALGAAGRDARALAMRSEELVLAFKAIEQAIGISVPERSKTGGSAMGRSQIIRALIEAYYAD